MTKKLKLLICALLGAAVLCTACSGENTAEESVPADSSAEISAESAETTEDSLYNEESSESAEESSIADETASTESSAEEKKEAVYTVKTFDSADAIDWSIVESAAIDTYKWVDSVEYEATAQLAYVKDYGFICRMTCVESDPPAIYTQFGDPVYLDSCMEFFAAWDGKSYINMEVNSIGTLCCQFGPSKQGRLSATDFLSLEEMFVATPVVGEEEWNITIDIPLEKLQRFYGENLSADIFTSGYSFKGNFYKIGSDPVTGVRHYGMWSVVDTQSPDFHRPEYFGTIVME